MRKILQILDGTPAEYGVRSTGQSLVELALVTPILIVLIFGLVEIGWFANNYLILLESTRTGARFGTVQTGETGPLAWNDDGSLVPANIKPFFPPAGTDGQATGVRNCASVSDPNTPQFAGFYSLLNCVVQRSMDPLHFHEPDITNSVYYPDDIIISAFALQLVDPRVGYFATTLNYYDASKTNGQLLATIDGIDANMPRVLVVGRYPKNANECTVDDDGKGAAMESRDPFDYIKNGQRDFFLLDPGLAPDPYVDENISYVELDGRDDHDLNNADTFEQQRGFSYVGQHYIGGATGPNVNCIGSEWTIAEVEQLINLPSFDLENAEQRSKLASMGMVLVEMFWKHELLLKNPVFNPVFSLLGDGSGTTTISVWAAFPVPAVEPRIRFPN